MSQINVKAVRPGWITGKERLMHSNVFCKFLSYAILILKTWNIDVLRSIEQERCILCSYEFQNEGTLGIKILWKSI